MDRRTNICIWIILIGLANFLVYTVMYMFIGGDAINGYVKMHDGQMHYYLVSGAPTEPGAVEAGPEVSRAIYIYSGIHSISIWVTVAAIMLAMLSLAKERIVSSMRSTIVRGRTFITILATVITFTTAVITFWFILQFARKLGRPEPTPPITQQTEANAPDR